ncbi:hypothetical protein FBU59_004098 [Linderina macrospora]|uniref:Uncharacterized protein n=1 Tax=Linderina macrospora TaxID=4868 RepID=A0ACC1J6J7_9FUNG|nr:hypothetical protein FBU59_004098 [Linderina macrospora]
MVSAAEVSATEVGVGATDVVSSLVVGSTVALSLVAVVRAVLSAVVGSEGLVGVVTLATFDSASVVAAVLFSAVLELGATSEALPLGAESVTVGEGLDAVASVVRAVSAVVAVCAELPGVLLSADCWVLSSLSTSVTLLTEPVDETPSTSWPYK